MNELNLDTFRRVVDEIQAKNKEWKEVIHSPMVSSQFHKQGKEFIKFAIRHRHEYTNLFTLSQHMRAVSKPVRTNINAILIFPFRDGTIYQNVKKNRPTSPIS